MKTFLFCALIALSTWSAQAQEPTQVNYVNELGLPFTGLYHMYSNNEVLIYSAQVEEGILNGSITYFDKAGRIDQVGHYAKGFKQGKWEQFNDAGNLIGEAFYVNGLKHGIWSVWDDNGVKRYHMVYDQGSKVDVWKVFDEKQMLVSERSYKK